MIGVPILLEMSMPLWNSFLSVKGEVRYPNRELNQPFVGRMDGVDESTIF